MVLPSDNSAVDMEADKVAQKQVVNSKVADILNAIKKPADAETKVLTKKQKEHQKQKNAVPRGMPKSGRPWKETKQKFSNIKKTIYRRTPQKKEELRHELKHIKALSKSIKEDKKAENEEKRMRREVNAKRKLENERKSEVVQVIKNPAKLKRMKKKALRKIEKRDLSTIKTV